MELQSQISWEKNQERIGKLTDVFLIEKKEIISWEERNMILQM